MKDTESEFSTETRLPAAYSHGFVYSQTISVRRDARLQPSADLEADCPVDTREASTELHDQKASGS
jgi:hypothetical protein